MAGPLGDKRFFSGRRCAAARQELSENRVLADRVSREINDALGQYDNLSPLEQRYVRSVVPFYGWYRAITIVMAKMPIDNPLRTNILAHIGQLGEQYQAPGYPYGGAIDLGDGRILKTAGLKPYTTPQQLVPDVATLARAYIGAIPGTNVTAPDVSDVAYAAGGLANPFLAAPIAGGISGAIQDLPEPQVLFPKKPKHPEKALYTDYDRKAYLLQYLGAPIRTLRKPNG